MIKKVTDQRQALRLINDAAKAMETMLALGAELSTDNSGKALTVDDVKYLIRRCKNFVEEFAD